MCLNPLRYTNSSNSELEKAEPLSETKMSGRPWVDVAIDVHAECS